jgi:hypothetical protein
MTKIEDDLLSNYRRKYKSFLNSALSEMLSQNFVDNSDQSKIIPKAFSGFYALIIQQFSTSPYNVSARKPKNKYNHIEPKIEIGADYIRTEPLPAKAGRFDLRLKPPKVRGTPLLFGLQIAVS